MEEIVDVRELVGVSLNARTANADSLPDRQVTLGAFGLANDLGRMLWRMKYGQDVKHSSLNRAALLLASMLRKFREFDGASRSGAKRRHRIDGHQTGAHNGDAIERFAYRAIAEWVADRCVECGGCGSIGGKERASTILPVQCLSCSGGGRLMAARRLSVSCDICSGTGSVTRRQIGPQREQCPSCKGSGRQRTNHWARAHALGLSLDQYHRHWESRFDSILGQLSGFDKWTASQVRRSMRR